jgi:hypothetical protein
MANHVVKKVFQLQDRLVIVSDAVGILPGLTHGGTVKLKRPDGSEIKTKTWLEFPVPSSADRPVSFSVEANFKKADIPEGTEICVGEEFSEDSENPNRRHTA